MARKIKFEKGKIYHLFNRGVEKRNIFINDSNRWRFLQGLFLFNNKDGSSNILWQLEREKGKMNFNVLREFTERERKDKRPLVRVMADCLMPNHYHLIIEELEDGGASLFMQRLGVGYTKYFNKKYDRVGSLFQGPFKSVLIEDDLQLKYLLIYINILNPGQLIEPNLKKDGIKNINAILKFAKEYLWSTNREYLGLRGSVIIDKGILDGLFSNPKEYEMFAKDILSGKKFNFIDSIALE